MTPEHDTHDTRSSGVFLAGVFLAGVFLAGVTCLNNDETRQSLPGQHSDRSDGWDHFDVLPPSWFPLAGATRITQGTMVPGHQPRTCSLDPYTLDFSRTLRGLSDRWDSAPLQHQHTAAQDECSHWSSPQDIGGKTHPTQEHYKLLVVLG